MISDLIPWNIIVMIKNTNLDYVYGIRAFTTTATTVLRNYPKQFGFVSLCVCLYHLFCSSAGFLPFFFHWIYASMLINHRYFAFLLNKLIYALSLSIFFIWYLIFLVRLLLFSWNCLLHRINQSKKKQNFEKNKILKYTIQSTLHNSILVFTNSLVFFFHSIESFSMHCSSIKLHVHYLLDDKRKKKIIYK